MARVYFVCVCVCVHACGHVCVCVSSSCVLHIPPHLTDGCTSRDSVVVCVLFRQEGDSTVLVVYVCVRARTRLRMCVCVCHSIFCIFVCTYV